MIDLSKHPEFLIRIAYVMLSAELEDLNDTESFLIHTLTTDENEERRFAAGGVLAGLSKETDDLRRILSLLKYVIDTHQDFLTHVAVVHALRLMPITTDLDDLLLYVFRNQRVVPLARAMAGSALIRHEQISPELILEDLKALSQHDDKRARTLALIAVDDAA